MYGEYTTEVVARIEHDFGARAASQTIQFGFDLFRLKAQRQYDRVDAGRAEHLQMPLEQCHAAEAQQTLGNLLTGRLLQARAAASSENDCSHSVSRMQCQWATGICGVRPRCQRRSLQCRYAMPGTPSAISRARFASESASATSGDNPTSGASKRKPPSCAPIAPGIANAAPRIACPALSS